MLSISSKDNPRFKYLKKLATQSGVARREEVALLEGEHLLEAFLLQAMVNAVLQERLFELYVTESKLPWVMRLTGIELINNRHIYVLNDSLITGLGNVIDHQGIVLLIKRTQPLSYEWGGKSVLYLDAVQDPGNVGTILRVAAAAGIQHIVLSPGCADAWSAKALRSGQGAQFHLTIHEQLSWDGFIQVAPALPIYTTALENASSLYELDLTTSCIWVFGNEGQGVSKEIINQATHCVRIPQSDAVESLNVASSVAICLFEQHRQFLLT